MGCRKCNGYWQCSDDTDPCAMQNSEALDAMDVEEKCFRVFTKRAGGSCKMKILHEGQADPTDFELAGELCFRFELFWDSNEQKCFVKVSPK